MRINIFSWIILVPSYASIIFYPSRPDHSHHSVQLYRSCSLFLWITHFRRQVPREYTQRLCRATVALTCPLSVVKRMNTPSLSKKMSSYRPMQILFLFVITGNYTVKLPLRLKPYRERINNTVYINSIVKDAL